MGADNRSPSTEVLADRIDKLQKDFDEYRRESRTEMRELDGKVDKAAEVSSKVDLAMSYMRESMGEMKEMMAGFTGIVKSQNDKIDEFVNSDKRAQAKKDLIVATLSAVGTIILTILTFWVSGKL